MQSKKWEEQNEDKEEEWIEEIIDNDEVGRMQENVKKNGADGSLDCVVNVAAALHRTDTIRCFGKEADFSCAFANELSTKRQTRFPGRGYCNEPVSQ